MRASSGMAWVGLALAAGLFAAGRGCTRSSAPSGIRPERPPAPEPGVALVIVYDTSGSMSDGAAGADGSTQPKYQIARQAALAVVDRLDAYAGGSGGPPRRLEAGLMRLDDRRPAAVIPLGPFRPEPFRRWLEDFSAPRGATPLGLAVREGARQLLATGLTRKHLLVITDGENTAGPDPASELASARAQAGALGASFATYFIAFDVNASVFNPVKREGADVFGAANGAELAEKLDYVLQEKILLENEEPPATTNRNGN